MTVIPFHRRAYPLPDAHNDLDMCESRLQAHWLHGLQDRDILYSHVYGGNYFHYGLPDLLIVGNGQFWAVELKTLRGTLSPMQERWKRELQAAGINYSVHTPAQWANGQSQRLLDSLAEDADVIDLANRAA